MAISRTVTSLTTVILAAALASSARADDATVGVSATAGTAHGTAVPAASPAAVDATAKSSDGPRRDPRGVKGISPFWEAIKRGDDAAAAQNLDGAKAAYDDAIKADPHNGTGQYRAGEIELLRGHLKEAEAAWEEALRFAGDNAGLKAKVLFVLADVKERQRALEEETNGWNAYETHARAAPSAKTFPDTAADRKKRVQEWKQAVIDYGAVKDRIKLRLDEANKKAAESAQSPQNR
jgi:tetratricopeptide (TPR) repeat protein